jgi:cardiolipin synthase A/B
MAITALRGNRVTLLKNGVEYFPALVAEIDTAQHEVRLETYIYADDSAGQMIGLALVRAARRGVNVRLLIDGFGSRLLPNAFVEDLRAAGVRVLIFRPDRPWQTFSRSSLRRLHRKIAVVDARVAFVGGINIFDDFSETPGAAPRFDYAVRVEGPLVIPIYRAVHRLWWQVQAMRGRVRRSEFARPQLSVQQAGDIAAAFVYRDNLRHRRDIEKMYLEGIAAARREIHIACAYFLPGRRMRQALMQAAARGVRVVLLLQGWSDHPVMLRATHVLYEALLDSGVEIHEYTRTELHAKVAVADDRWATVGSSNLDPFSLFLAREANVAIFDETFAKALRVSIEEEMGKGAVAVPRMLWKHRSLAVRFASWFAYGYARLAIGLAGLGARWR